MIRAKFMLQEIAESGYSYTDKDGKRVVSKNTGKKLVFFPQYDTSIPEDQRFAQATPSGRFEMTVDNPSALAQFEIGHQYYVDFHPVESAERAE